MNNELKLTPKLKRQILIKTVELKVQTGESLINMVGYPLTHFDYGKLLRDIERIENALNVHNELKFTV